jgi:2-polyprenyl-3-methyl-5-hydroxy-6-metoxy-1,4-benzoquinol methylase
MNHEDRATENWVCWCGSSDHQLCWRTRQFGLLRCRACGCYRIDPPALSDDPACEQFYTTYYEAPPQQRQDGRRARTQHRSSRFWDVAAAEPQLLRPGNSALDVGCGEGQLCAELLHHGWRSVAGVDISKTRIRRARERHPNVDFYDVPLAQTDVPPGSFDLVVMDNVIEHLPDPLATVRELRKYVAPRGQFVIVTPNMESGHYRLLRRRWTPELAPHAHIYLFTPAALERLLGLAGFDLRSTASFHDAALPISAMLSRARRGDVKGAIWRAVQEMGGVYGHLIGAGPMLYAISSAIAPVDSRSSCVSTQERAAAAEETAHV